MTERDDLPNDIYATIRWPLLLTRLGMIAESVVRAFWPFWSVLFVALAFLMMGLQDVLPIQAVWSVIALFALGGIGFLVRGVKQFHWPTRNAAFVQPSTSPPLTFGCAATA